MLEDLKMPTTRQRVRLDAASKSKSYKTNIACLMEGTCVGVPDGLIEFFVDARGPEDADYKTESQNRCPLQVKELHQ